MIDFKNKKIIITGASGGIGRSLVEKFVNLNGNVLATGTKIEKLENLKKNFGERMWSMLVSIGPVLLV